MHIEPTTKSFYFQAAECKRFCESRNLIEVIKKSASTINWCVLDTLLLDEIRNLKNEKFIEKIIEV